MEKSAYIYILAWALLSAVCAASEVKPDFKTLYINDVSHIAACVSPYHKDGEPINDAMIEASVDETFYGSAVGGVDVHMLQPCFTWVPWWKSKIYPADEHYKWFYNQTGFAPNPMGIDKYMIGGGDMVETFVNRCRKLGIAPFISYRLNDRHYKEQADIALEIMNGSSEFDGFDPGPGLPGLESCVSKFFLENQKWWIGPEPKVPPEGRLAFLSDVSYRGKLRRARSMNWAVPEVRDHVFSLIDEICTNYDIDGLELDFMRHDPFFRAAETTQGQREEIMFDFVARVRKSLDDGARPGQRRWLSVRVPFRTAEYNMIGVNLPEFVKAGVDMVNLSCGYVTEQQNDVGKICKIIPGTPVFLEFTYLTGRTRLSHINNVEGKQIQQFTLYRHTTDEQIYTLAHLAYERGAQGISSFNFPYYRRFGEKIIGTACEPPFHVFRNLQDKEWISRQPQHYFVSSRDFMGNCVTGQYAANADREIQLDMAEPLGGWKNKARLRIQTGIDVDCVQFEVKFNDNLLQATDNISEFYPVANPDALGNSKNLRAWDLPAKFLKSGVNVINIRPSVETVVSYIDIGTK